MKQHNVVVFALAAVALVIGTVIQVVAGKRFAIANSQYPFVTTQLSPICGGIVYALLCMGTALLKRSRSRDQAGSAQHAEKLLTSGVVDSEIQGLVPPDVAEEQTFSPLMWWRHAAIIAFLFSLSNTLNNLGNRGSTVPGALVVVLSRMVVPLSLVLEWTRSRMEAAAVTRTVCTWPKLLAVFLLFGGTAVAMGPLWASIGDADTMMVLERSVELICANIPLALAMNYFEYISKKGSIDIVKFWLCICVCQTLWGFIPMAYVNAAIQGQALSDVWSDFGKGGLCVMTGENPEGDLASDCSLARLVWFVFTVPSGCVFNMGLAYLSKHPWAGPTTVWFLRAVTVPASGLLFASELLMGPYSSPITGYDVGGLCVVFLALMLYQWKDLIKLIAKFRSVQPQDTLEGDTDITPEE